MTSFDQRTFLSLADLPLSDYADAVRDKGYIGLNRETVRSLADRIETMSGLHGIYIMFWALHFGLPDLSGPFQRLICNPTLGPGERATAFLIGFDIPDLTAEAVDAIEQAGLPNTWGVVSDNVAALRRKIAARGTNQG
jgi:hypothetical protein